MEVNPTWLQFGALGLLTLVLAFVGGFVKKWMEDNSTFIRSQVEDSNRRWDKALGEMHGLTKQYTEVSIKSTEAINQITKELGVFASATQIIASQQKETIDAICDLRDKLGEL